ncbi:hypothetical protein PPEP_a0418 [Pseudoalteromonas peptidolytica F12-50-A1]|uniref:Uncharacterized protein n=1 Tax=Pseudoalteromonas peptidolytica F12-50-A1 TaxID=1315280 RepID=A0A8I0T337_9GAMM|nr:hypothetical protein [Pseudoalteromonas peptidolytica F12-50-A1]
MPDSIPEFSLQSQHQNTLIFIHYTVTAMDITTLTRTGLKL